MAVYVFHVLHVLRFFTVATGLNRRPRKDSGKYFRGHLVYLHHREYLWHLIQSCPVFVWASRQVPQASVRESGVKFRVLWGAPNQRQSQEKSAALSCVTLSAYGFTLNISRSPPASLDLSIRNHHIK